MYENNDYGLEEIQEDLLQVAKVFDEICRKNKIHYALHGGTLLGAERNHKFIPWDDDIDVSMKRSEYKRFKEIADNLPKGFELDEQTMWFPRLVMRKDKDVVYVDILIWDYISSNRMFQLIKITLLRFYQGMMKNNIEYEKFNSIYKLLLFFTHVVGKIIPDRIKHRQFDFLCERAFVGEKKNIHRANDSFWPIDYIFDSRYMDGYQNIEFEGHLFMVNKRYREFLERTYGENYLTPPPIEERIPGHEKFRNDL